LVKEDMEKYNPDIIHLHSYAIDKEILGFILNNYRDRTVYTVHSVVPYDDLNFLLDFGIDVKNNKELVRELVKKASLEENLEIAAEDVIRKYKIPSEAKTPIAIALYMIALQKELLNNSRYITYISPFVKEKIREIYGIEKGIIIPNGTDIFRKYEGIKERINRIAEEWKRNNNFSDKILILYTGRIVEDKGVLDLIKAFKELEDKDIVLYLSGSYTEEMREKIDKIVGKDGRIYIIDDPKGAPEDSLLATYIAADIVVYPSKHEPFGLVPIEAASLGKEVIVRYVDNLKTFVDEGIAEGFETKEELKEKLKEVINKVREFKKLAKKLAKYESPEDLEKANRYLQKKIEKMKYVRERYSIDKCREEYKKLYEQLIFEKSNSFS